jgi:hypothetical protein
MAMTKEELAEFRGHAEEKNPIPLSDKCRDCEFKKTCLIRDENKRI